MDTKTHPATITRDELIELCAQAIVPLERWDNRDSAAAQQQIGRAWALLKAGAPFSIGDDTDDRTWWINVTIPGFLAFERGVTDPDNHDVEIFYIPTAANLTKNQSGDWY